MHKGSPEVTFDFYTDWIQMLRGELQAEGYQVSPAENSFDVCKKYFNAQKRRISNQTRTVLVSKEFTCPPEYEVAVDTIKDKAAKGEDLTPHLSKSILDADYNDSLLNDWGIHHFHLVTLPDPKDPRFVERTGPLLFARVTNEHFYLINVMEHGSWTRKQLIEILHANWPDSLRSHKLHEIPGSHYTEDEIRQFRGHNVQTLIDVSNGTVYAPLGGGYLTSGVSIEVVMQCDYLKACISKLEEYVKQNALHLAEQAYRQQRAAIGPQLHFRLEELRIEAGAITEMHLIEQHSGVKFTIKGEAMDGLR